MIVDLILQAGGRFDLEIQTNISHRSVLSYGEHRVLIAQ